LVFRPILAPAGAAVIIGRKKSQQLQFFPQLQALLSFIGQFLPLFLQLCGVGSAANALVQIAAARIENRIFAYVFILSISLGK